MVYSEQTWVAGSGGGTPLSADRLNHMEEGIGAAHAYAQGVSVVSHGATGDGATDDTAAIQAAVAAAPDGGAILLPPGTYRITAIISVGKRLQWRGSGATLLADTAGLNSWFTLTAGASGSALSGITFDSNDLARGVVLGDQADDVTVTGCTFTGYSDASGYDGADAAIKVSVASGWRIINNTFKDWGFTAQIQRCVALNDSAVTDCIVSGNTFENVQSGVTAVGEGHVIDGNTFRNLGDNAVYCTTSSTAGVVLRDITITGNTFVDCDEGVAIVGGVGTEWAENFTITGNVFRDWTARGLGLAGRIRNLTVLGNDFTNSAAAPGGYITLRTQVDTSLTQDVTIVGNTLRGNIGFAAMWLQVVSRAIVTGNVFELATTGVNQFVIRFQYDTTALSVYGNHFTVTGTDQATCYLIDVRGGVASECRYFGNTNIGGRTFGFAGFTSLDKSAALPGASAAYRGQLRYVEGGAGVADTVQVCLKSAGDTYSWKVVATG